MAEDIRHFTVTTPAGTPLASPLVTPVSFPPRKVVQVDWRVPNGAMGTMGFLLAMGTVPVLPVYGTAQWVIANDEQGTWNPTDYPDSGAWSVWSYNTGNNPHAVYLTFHCDLTSRPAPVAPILEPRMLTGAPDLSRAGPPVRPR